MEEENMAGKTSMEQSIEKKQKQIQMDLLNRLASGGGMNQNDLMAYMSMLQKQEPNAFQDMMPLILAMKMMNPTPKSDNSSPMMFWMMMDSMRKGGDGDIERKLDKLEAALKSNEDKKHYEAVMNEIRNLKTNKSDIGMKDLLTLMMSKDDIIAKARSEADIKGNELMVTHLKGSFDALQNELKKVGTGGDIGKMGQMIKQIKEISETLGIGKVAPKPKEEVLKEIIQAGIAPLTPVIENYFKKMGQQDAQRMSPDQLARLQQIQAQRSNQNPGTQLVQPQPIPATPVNQPDTNQSMGLVSKDAVFPDLIDIADGGVKANRRLNLGNSP